MVVLCSTFHWVTLVLGCTTSRGSPSHSLFFTVFGYSSRSPPANPPTSWREHVQSAWLHSLLTEQGDEVNDIRDELEMVSAFKSFHVFCRADYSMRVRLTDGFVFERFSV